MNQQDVIMVACPTCKKAVAWTADEPFKPFCSQRCKLIDLGDWATEVHKIPGGPVLPDLDQSESDDY